MDNLSGERRFKLTLHYDGAGFFGWQVQPGVRTVQAELEAGRLVEVLAAHRPAPLEVNLLFSGHAWLPAQTRAFIDLARDHFGLGSPG